MVATAPFSSVKSEKILKIEICQHVSIQHKERLIQILDHFERPTGSERGLFNRIVNLYIPFFAISQYRLDQMGEMSDSDRNPAATSVMELPDQDLHYRLVAYRHQGLREDRRVRPETGASSAGKHHSPHD